jgi:hypothetical protein
VATAVGLAIVEQLAARNAATVELRAADPTGIDAVVTFGSTTRADRRRQTKATRSYAKG